MKAVQEKPQILLLGHKGKLGSAVFYQLLKNKDRYKVYLHEYRLSPDRLDIDLNPSYLNQFDYVINCLSDNIRGPLTDNARFINITLPIHLSNYSNRLIQISSDYVFKKEKDTEYTAQKKEMECRIYKDKTLLIRTSNLISDSDDDNFLFRFKQKKVILVDNVPLFPTCVDALSKFILQNINFTGVISVYGTIMTKEQVCKDLGVDYALSSSTSLGHYKDFIDVYTYSLPQTRKTYNELCFKYNPCLKTLLKKLIYR